MSDLSGKDIYADITKHLEGLSGEDRADEAENLIRQVLGASGEEGLSGLLVTAARPAIFLHAERSRLDAGVDELTDVANALARFVFAKLEQLPRKP